MKYLALLAAFMVSLPSITHAQSRTKVQPQPVRNALLVEILNWGERQDLMALPNAPSELDALLYSVADEGSCVPDTHAICSYRYYLAVAEAWPGVGQDAAVYALGRVGEITRAEWLEGSRPDRGRLRLEVSNYPEHAFEVNPALVRRTRAITLEVGYPPLKVSVIR